jgi:16S rRNA processing protein RimM
LNEDASPWVVLAHILRPQGRKGEVLAELLTDFPERFNQQRRIFLAPDAFAGLAADARAAEVENFWLPMGKNEGRIVLQFSGVDSIDAAERLSGLDVIVPRSERIELEDDANYISDLIGCEVYDCANPQYPVSVGVVTDVQFASTPDGGRRLEDAAPLLVLESGQGEVLIPFAKAFLVALRLDEKRIDMSLPQGLIEVNRQP